MPTDLRAALRDAADTFTTLARRSERSEMHPLVDPITYDRAAMEFRALADAPPTVAELIAALPNPGLGRPSRRVEWESVRGIAMRARRSGASGLIVERAAADDSDLVYPWLRTVIDHADLTQPARLVEVTP